MQPFEEWQLSFVKKLEDVGNMDEMRDILKYLLTRNHLLQRSFALWDNTQPTIIGKQTNKDSKTFFKFTKVEGI